MRENGLRRVHGWARVSRGAAWVLLAGVLLLVLAGTVTGCAGSDGRVDGAVAEVDTADDQAARMGEATPTPGPAAKARAFADRGRYDDAIALLEETGQGREADRVRRRGARALARSAQRALTRGRHTTAKRLATRSRRLHRTAAARTIITSADAELAKAAAAKRERERLARIARDQRTCSSAEKRTVRAGGATPPGCADYATAQAEKDAVESCDPNYAGACLKPGSFDYDCAGGSGDGPDYTGPVRVVGSDPHGLDRDGDGSACESS